MTKKSPWGQVGKISPETFQKFEDLKSYQRRSFGRSWNRVRMRSPTDHKNSRTHSPVIFQRLKDPERSLAVDVPHLCHGELARLIPMLMRCEDRLSIRDMMQIKEYSQQ